jgi:hypothetical protein
VRSTATGPRPHQRADRGQRDHEPDDQERELSRSDTEHRPDATQRHRACTGDSVGATTYDPAVLIHAAARPREDNGERRHWSVSSDDYDSGRAQIIDELPGGWILLYLRPERA